MNTAMPPQWAEVVLRLLLAPQDRETVSGDLLEEYRECMHPVRGRTRADLWYVRQVAGFAGRANRTWAALLSGAFVARTALDWFLPTADFHARSTTLTAVTAAIFLSAGFQAAWRSHAAASGAVAGVATCLVAAIPTMLATAFLLALSRDPATLAAIEASGGRAEAFTLLLLLIVPGALLGGVGGLFGGTVRRLAWHSR